MKLKGLIGAPLAIIMILLATAPIQAQLADSNVVPGIERVTGAMSRINPPLSVQEGDLEIETSAFVFIERQNFTLQENIRLNISNTGQFRNLNDAVGRTLPAGTEINSYYVHFDPSGFSVSLPGVEGSAVFEQDILGFIVTQGSLEMSTRLLGAEGTRYDDDAEVAFREEILTISENRRTFRFDFNNNARFVELRIITVPTGSDDDGGGNGGNGDNNSPNARNDSVDIDEDETITIDVLDNDTDSNDNIDEDTLRITEQPDDGTATLNSSAATITYEPDNGFQGTDTFEYEICDTTDRCDTATVTVRVATDGGDSDSPNARNDSVNADEDETVTIDVLDNDTDSNNNIDEDSLRITQQPDDGTATVNSTAGTVTYNPDSGFEGTDSFEYEICDSTDRCDTATVTVRVGRGGGDGGGVTLRTLLPEADDCSAYEQARIDIVPGNRENSIRLDDETGLTPVAILSTVHFPAPNCVDVSTVTFGPTGDELEPETCGVVNVNFDRWPDVVCDFKTTDLEFEVGDTTGQLEADTIENDAISETDEVNVIEPRRFRSMIPARDQSALEVKALHLGQSLFVSARGSEVSGMSIQIFNSSGMLVGQENSNGNLLRVNLRSQTGQPLANGVYIYVVSAYDFEGNLVGHSVKKLAIVR